MLGVMLIFAATSRGVLLFGDDILMFQVTESLVERQSVSVTSPTAAQVVVSHPDLASSFNAASIPGVDGRGYAKYGIGLSLVAVPSYVLGAFLDPLDFVPVLRDPFDNVTGGPRVFVTSLSNAVLGSAAVAMLYLLSISVGYSRLTALALALAAAFATPLAHYSGTFLSEPLAALCLTVSIYGILRASLMADTTRHAALRWLFISGFAAGLGVATKSALAVALIAPALWVLWLAWRWPHESVRGSLFVCVAWSAPVAGWLAAIALYNATRFGSVLETGYGDEAGAYTTPLLTGFYGLMASPGRGLLWYAPPLLLSLAGAFWFRRRSAALALVILGTFVATLALYSRYYAWHGGGVWSPRFLVPLLPLLLLPAGEVVERALRNRIAAVTVVATFTCGVAVSALALLVPFDRYVAEYTASAEATDRALWSLAGSPLVAHAGDVARLDITLDIAAMRYGSLALAAGSLFCALLGLAVLSVVAMNVLRWRDSEDEMVSDQV